MTVTVTVTLTLTVAATDDLAACHALRRIVFIGEQGVSEAEEMDDLDAEAVHLLATGTDGPLGTARLLEQGDTGKIGRVCVLAQARSKGVGSALIRAAVAHFRTRPGIARVKLGAQTHALLFYERLGFVAYGPQYMDANIPHRDMVMVLEAGARRG